MFKIKSYIISLKHNPIMMLAYHFFSRLKGQVIIPTYRTLKQNYKKILSILKSLEVEHILTYQTF